MGMIFYLVTAFALVYTSCFSTFPYWTNKEELPDNVIGVTLAAHAFSITAFALGALATAMPKRKFIWITVLLICLLAFTLNLARTIMIHTGSAKDDINDLYSNVVFRVELVTIMLSVACMIITVFAYHRSALKEEENEPLIDKEESQQEQIQV